MGDNLEKKASFRELLATYPAVSNRTWEFILSKIQVHVLEMEDVLFHHNSAVMMPSRPEGASSQDGTEDDSSDSGDQAVTEAQSTYSGVKALAMVFVQLETEPNQRMIIAGHTDTSGEDSYNFVLSDERARNVLYLLTGEREAWAEVCEGKQKVEDFQQILKHYNRELRWNCDPGDIDDDWGDNTYNATRAFVNKYNFEFALPNHYDTIPTEEVTDRVRPARRWTQPLWQAVFNLYSREISQTLGIRLSEFDQRREALRNPATHRFVSFEKKYVACGESFPIDDAEKENYRSQSNRRVVILFFDSNEMPQAINCPARTSSKHTEAECPLWHEWHFMPLYIDPADRYSVVYHMSFKYYNQFLDRIMDVPEGLQITAFENDSEERDTVVQFRQRGNNGIYHVRVRFESPLDDGTHRKLHFEFRTNNRWIFTRSRGTAPAIVTKTPDEMNALNADDQLTERAKYYDLPAHWSSRNYWTRYDGDIDRGDVFEKVIKDIKGLKPLGGNYSDPERPLVFSLDDVVLLDTANGTQDVKDADHSIPANDQDLAMATGADPDHQSRVKIFVVDPNDGYLRLYQSGADARTARIPFSQITLQTAAGPVTSARNYIVAKAEDTKRAKIVFFRDGFYTIGSKRTRTEADWADKGFVVGARAAVRNDADYHVPMGMFYTAHEFGSTGDYDLHYFHHLWLQDRHPVSFTISYVSICFMADTRGAPHAPIPGAADVKTYEDEGVYNAIAHWNRKKYFMRQEPESETSTIIRPFYFFDERETFEIAAPAGGFNINFDRRPADPPPNPMPVPPPPAHMLNTSHVDLFNHANLTTAQQNALGGRSKFIAMVCQDTNGAWGPAYQWSIRNEGPTHYSLFKLNKSGYVDQNGLFTNVPVNEHTENYGAHTFAHELGHSTGQPDEYINDTYQPDAGNNDTYPDFGQYYVAYSMPRNTTSMMYGNGAPRAHHVWYPMHRINEEADGGLLNALLAAKHFLARLNRGAGWDYTFNRRITGGDPNVPSILENPVASAQHFTFPAAADRELNLALYDTASDEASDRYFHINQHPTRYQGVLVVRVMLSIDFSNDASWTAANMHQKIDDIEAEWNSWREHFRLINGTKDFERIYIHFLAGYSTDLANADRNYILDFRNAATPAAGDRIPNAGGTLRITNGISAAELARYFLNSTLADGQLAALGFLKTWVDGQLGDNFTLEQF